MKVFISSVISGMEHFRETAKAAIQSLGYESICAEDFTASPRTARVACLEGVRKSDIFILLCGERYGDKQASGLSATHEEYEEAKERCQVFAFVQSGCTFEEGQKEFIQKIQHYNTGHYTNTFSDNADLRDGIIKTLHQWAVAQSSGSINSQEMLERALSFVNETDRGYSGNLELAVIVSGGPSQSIIRPTKLENETFIEKLSQMASYGPEAVLTRREGIEELQEGHALLLKQNSRSLLIDEQGSISLRVELKTSSSGMSVIIQEDILEKITKALKFFEKVLNEIDPTERLSHVTIVAAINSADYHAWRTKSENEANPSSVSLGFARNKKKIVHLSPPHRTRGTFRTETDSIAEDLTTLLRRCFS